MRAGGRCGSVPLHALERGAFGDGDLQLHVLTLVLVEVHLTIKEVDTAALHFKGAGLWIIMHCPAHIQHFLSPSFNDSLIPNFLNRIFGYLEMRGHFPFFSPWRASAEPLALQQFAFFQDELEDGLTLHIHLFQALLQSFEGLGQVPRLPHCPHCKYGTANGQGQRDHGHERPNQAQRANASPLKNPLHCLPFTVHRSRASTSIILPVYHANISEPVQLTA